MQGGHCRAQRESFVSARSLSDTSVLLTRDRIQDGAFFSSYACDPTDTQHRVEDSAFIFSRGLDINDGTVNYTCVIV